MFADDIVRRCCFRPSHGRGQYLPVQARIQEEGTKQKSSNERHAPPENLRRSTAIREDHRCLNLTGRLLVEGNYR